MRWCRTELCDVSIALRTFVTLWSQMETWEPSDSSLPCILLHIYPQVLLVLPSESVQTRTTSLSTSVTLPKWHGLLRALLPLLSHCSLCLPDSKGVSAVRSHPCPESFHGPPQLETQSSLKTQACTPSRGSLGSPLGLSPGVRLCLRILPDPQGSEFKRSFLWEAFLHLPL